MYAEEEQLDDAMVQAVLEEMERRIGLLELVCFGSMQGRMTNAQAHSLYVEVTRIMGHGKVSSQAVRGWARAFLLLAEPHLVHLVKVTNHPTPWGVFFRFIEALKRAGDEEELVAAESHVREVAKRVLRLQGLGIVEPEDAINTDHPAVNAMRKGRV